MPLAETLKFLLLIPVATIVTYFDVRYRRIPNLVVLITLISGLALNTSVGGWHGTLGSLEGLLFAFVPMLLLHLFGAMGAGDVKLAGAVGAVLGVSLVPSALIIIVMLGAALAIYSMIR